MDYEKAWKSLVKRVAACNKHVYSKQDLISIMTGMEYEARKKDVAKSRLIAKNGDDLNY